MSNTTTTETINIENYFTAQSYTGYGLIKETNRLLSDLGIEKVLPGPMGYTYLKKGYVVEGTKDIKSCSGEDGRNWAVRYIAKLTVRVQNSMVETEETEKVSLVKA